MVREMPDGHCHMWRSLYRPPWFNAKHLANADRQLYKCHPLRSLSVLSIRSLPGGLNWSSVLKTHHLSATVRADTVLPTHPLCSIRNLLVVMFSIDMCSSHGSFGPVASGSSPSMMGSMGSTIRNWTRDLTEASTIDANMRERPCAEYVTVSA
jgi:hypothetical protein